MSANRCILIVEDDALIGMDLSMTLEEDGWEPCGPYESIADALLTLEEKPIGGAIVDINSQGRITFEVADALAARDIPFFFVTGHSNAILPRHHSSRTILTKPYTTGSLLDTLAKTFKESSN